jgi:hypothetical protein
MTMMTVIICELVTQLSRVESESSQFSSLQTLRALMAHHSRPESLLSETFYLGVAVIAPMLGCLDRHSTFNTPSERHSTVFRPCKFTVSCTRPPVGHHDGSTPNSTVPADVARAALCRVGGRGRRAASASGHRTAYGPC